MELSCQLLLALFCALVTYTATQDTTGNTLIIGKKNYFANLSYYEQTIVGFFTRVLSLSDFFVSSALTGTV